MGQRKRRRFSLWRFVLAMLLGIGTWLGVSWLTEPRPVWRIKPQGNRMLFPTGTNKDESLTLAYEFALNPGQGWEPGPGGLCILDSTSGTRLHQLESDSRVFDGDSYFELLHAQPRIIGTIAWRITRRQVDQDVLFELRAWDFSRDEGEKVIHAWKHETGQHFKIAFADNKSPYLITQTSYPWQPLLVGMSMDGWSRLICALSNTHQNDDKAGIFTNPTQTVFKKGLVLPFTQTWKLPDRLAESFKPLASWLLPPLRQAWPPAKGPDLHWVAFGNSRVDHEWKATNIPSDNVLVYDGHTGVRFKLAIDSPLEECIVSAAGNLLLIRQDANQQHPPFLIDVKTGARLQWPADAANLKSITEVHDVRNSDGVLLVFCEMVSSIDGAGVLGVPVNRSGATMLMKRQDNVLSLITQTPLQFSPQLLMQFPTTLARLELVVQTLADSAPPFLRELSTRWDWLKPYVDKYWPDQQPTINVYDLMNGQVIKTISNAYPSQLYQFHQSSLLFVMRTKPGNLNQSELEAWKLPIAIHCYSPWWGRTSGILVFLLVFWLLHRSRGADPTAL